MLEPIDIICDIDGSLSNPDHRRWAVATKPKNWKAFFATQNEDGVHWDIVRQLRLHKLAGDRIVISTGRDEEFREVTEIWLRDVAGISDIIDKVYMRPLGDRRSDYIVKIEMLDRMRTDGYSPVICYDDRQSVVDAWRKAGLRCLQVCASHSEL